MPVTIRRFQRDAIDGVVITRLGDDVGCSQTTDREASDRARAHGDNQPLPLTIVANEARARGRASPRRNGWTERVIADRRLASRHHHG